MSNWESINQLFADLHAHRVATFKPEDLAVNINQRKYLVENADRSKFWRCPITSGSSTRRLKRRVRPWSRSARKSPKN